MEIIKQQLNNIINSIKEYVDPVRSCTGGKGASCILEAFDTLGIISKKYYNEEEEKAFCENKDRKIQFLIAYSLKDKSQYYVLTTVWGLVSALVAQLAPLAATGITCAKYGGDVASIMFLLTEMLTIISTWIGVSKGVSSLVDDTVLEGYKTKIESFLEDVANVNVTIQPRERGETMLVTLSPKKEEDALKY